MERFDYVTKLYDQLKTSTEYQKWNEWVDSFKDNLKLKDFDNLYSLLQNTHVVRKILDRIDSILEDIIRELIGNVPNILIQVAYGHVSINYNYAKIPSYEYKEHHWASPPGSIIKVNFWEKEIVIFDTEQEFKKAAQIEKENLAREKEKLQNMQAILAQMNSKVTKWQMLKEICHNRLTLLIYTAHVYLVPSEAKTLKKFYDKLIKHQQELCEIQEEKVKRMTDKNYMGILEEIKGLQSKFIEKLKILGFKTRTEKIVYNFDNC